MIFYFFLFLNNKFEFYVYYGVSKHERFYICGNFCNFTFWNLKKTDIKSEYHHRL